MRTAGIDPGTYSMDICAIENGLVCYEQAIPTPEIARKPKVIIEAIEAAFPLELIAAPSGYGVGVTKASEIELERFKDWYYNYILLTTREEIESAVKQGVFGALVYYAMTESTFIMRKRGFPIVFIPGVVNLATVPRHRKINKLDMGTADKMSVSILGVYDQARRLSIPYSEVSFILVEMGFGYNAVIGVERGRIVDGVGGTTIPSPGFLTAGCIDLELAQIVGKWEKADVFTGGAALISGRATPEELASCLDEERCKLAWEAMMEGVEKAVASLLVSIPRPREILTSGRITRIKRVKAELKERLSKYAEVRELGYLEGAKITKETAQGYAMLADGLAGGKFQELVDYMKIKEARGSCIDYIYHPAFARAREKFVAFKGQGRNT
ncbi:MAG: DUF1464 family protein [Methanocellales archaeon]